VSVVRPRAQVSEGREGGRSNKMALARAPLGRQQRGSTKRPDSPAESPVTANRRIHWSVHPRYVQTYRRRRKGMLWSKGDSRGHGSRPPSQRCARQGGDRGGFRDEPPSVHMRMPRQIRLTQDAQSRDTATGAGSRSRVTRRHASITVVKLGATRSPRRAFLAGAAVLIGVRDLGSSACSHDQSFPSLLGLHTPLRFHMN